MNELFNQIKELGLKYGAGKIVLFGSRARGDHQARSDIDIAVFGLPTTKQAPFALAMEDLPTLLKIDIVFVGAQTPPELLAEIEKEGKTIMERQESKLLNFQKAFDRLQEAVPEYEKTKSETVRDGVIQRFEFTAELAWKVVREYLLEQGYSDINSPKAVMRTAYTDGLIDDQEAWISLLNDRNVTSHIYDDGQASAVYGRISALYLGLFQNLLEKLS